VKPVLGRDFTPDDDQHNGPPVVLVSYRLWKERFGGDPQAVGHTLVLNGKTFTIFGVLPQRFQFLADADVITPLRPQMPAIHADRSVHASAVVARLRPGVSIGQAQSEFE
jgi:putative ABC transport system permease protein